MSILTELRLNLFPAKEFVLWVQIPLKCCLEGRVRKLTQSVHLENSVLHELVMHCEWKFKLKRG